MFLTLKSLFVTIALLVSASGAFASELQNWAPPGGIGNGGPVNEALITPQYMQMVNGDLWITDYPSKQFRVVPDAGPVDGTEQKIFKENSFPSSPLAFVTIPDGRTFIGFNAKLTRLENDGTLTTVYTDGSFGPFGMTYHNGWIFIADATRSQIRAFNPNTNSMVIVVNQDAVSGFTGDNGPAIGARLANPNDVTFDGDTMYISDTSNNRIRKVLNGVITTFAGGGAWTAPLVGDGGPANNARLQFPGMVRARNGEVFIADKTAGRVRKVGLDGIITTVAGNGALRSRNPVFNPDPLQMNLGEPYSLEFDGDGNLFIGSTYIPAVYLLLNPSSPTATMTQVASETPTDTPTSTATNTLAVDTVTPSRTRTSTVTITLTRTASVTLTRTATITLTPLPSVTQTAIPTYTSSPTDTPSYTPTNTPTETPVNTATRTRTASPVPTETDVPTWTPTFTALPTQTETATPRVLIYCDVTGNGGISTLDSAWIQQYVAGLKVFSDTQKELADATGNGKVSVLDAVAILQLIAGFQPSDPGYVPNRCGQIYHP